MCVGQCIAFDSPISTTESTDEVGGVIERVSSNPNQPEPRTGCSLFKNQGLQHNQLTDILSLSLQNSHFSPPYTPPPQGCGSVGGRDQKPGQAKGNLEPGQARVPGSLCLTCPFTHFTLLLSLYLSPSPSPILILF